MNLNTLFSHRDDWQRNAFNSIKNDLIAARDKSYVQYDSAEEDHVVMIYGKSQVGKTTLILSMIGIRSGQPFREVHDTLRADIERGNSSTSTAIVYARSFNDSYGCAMASLDNFPPRDIQYYSSEGMKQRLKEIRADVEAQRASADLILYIALPRRCFISQAAEKRISILDMPGVGSRNHKEYDHIRNLMARYFPIASACIIACTSNNIQELESMELPIGYNWKQMEHRFALAVTHAYSDSTLKKYFSQSRQNREKGFYQYIMDVYTEELRTILGEGNRLKICPVDVGDSLEKLCAELDSVEDRAELLETGDRILLDLRRWITSRQDSRLKAALSNLRDLVHHYGESEIREIERKIKETREDIGTQKRSIDRRKQKIRDLIGDINGEDTDSMYREIQQELEAMRDSRKGLEKCRGTCITALYPSLEKALQEAKLEKDFLEECWKDKNEVALSKLRDIAVSEVMKSIQYIKPLIDLPAADILIEADNLCVQAWEQAAPTSKGFFNFWKGRVRIDKLEEACNIVEDTINQRFDSRIDRYIEKLNSDISEKKLKLKWVEHRVKMDQDTIRQMYRAIETQKGKIQKYRKEQGRLEHRRAKDQKTLDMYLHYTRRAYRAQRDRLVSEINSGLPREETMLRVLFLGVLDKDYYKVTGGTYENGNSESGKK